MENIPIQNRWDALGVQNIEFPNSISKFQFIVSVGYPKMTSEVSPQIDFGAQRATEERGKINARDIVHVSYQADREGRSCWAAEVVV